jgi:hypothetical protein
MERMTPNTFYKPQLPGNHKKIRIEPRQQKKMLYMNFLDEFKNTSENT